MIVLHSVCTIFACKTGNTTIMTEEKIAVERHFVGSEAQHATLKAALIDMDGVLYDSMKGHTAAWYRMACELGIECTRDEFYAYEGMTGAATINILFNRAYGRDATAEEVKELYARKAAYFIEMGEPEMMPGAALMLERLRNAGVQRVLVTGSGQHSILDRLDRDYPGMFSPDKRVTALNVTHGKPDPEPYLKGLQLAGCRADEAIVIENAPLGVLAGHRSGCFTVGITTGPIPEADMTAAGADIVYPSMPEFASRLPLLLNALNNRQTK